MVLMLSLIIGCNNEVDVDTSDTGFTGHMEDPKQFTNYQIIQLRRHWPLPQVPLQPTNAVADDPYAAHLGQFLFFDERLSNGNEVSCATCHNPELGWSDGERVSIDGLEDSARHAPTLWNSGYIRWAFWDGRCDSLWCQATSPIEAAGEMGGNRMAVAHLIANDSELKDAYEAIFGALPDLSDESRFPDNARPDDDPEHPYELAWNAMRSEDRETVNVVFTNITKSIAAFERLIISRNSPFDEFAEAILTGENLSGLDSISDSAARGLKLFIGEAQCHLCHEGPNFTNQEFSNIGLGPRDWLLSDDHGRIDGASLVLDNPFNGIGAYSDDPEAADEQLIYLSMGSELDGQFKIPTLRNVTTHPPYMHGGHFETLEECVNHYIDPTETPEFGHREDIIQAPWSTAINLSPETDLPDIVEFLKTLTSPPLPTTLTTQPASPVLD